MPRPIHFEIPAEDPEKLSRFYGEVFGWKFDKWDGPMDYWLITTGKEGERGIDGGMGRKQEGSGPCNTIDVPSVDRFTAAVEKQGGRTILPKVPVPGIGWLAYCTDPEGNVFGIMEADPQAR